MFLLNRYAAISVYALEPNQESYALAERNLALYAKRAILIPAALSTAMGSISFSGTQMGVRIGEGRELRVATPRLTALLGRIPEGHIDILKMEILFGDVFEWLSHVSLLIIETHGSAITEKPAKSDARPSLVSNPLLQPFPPIPQA